MVKSRRREHDQPVATAAAGLAVPQENTHTHQMAAAAAMWGGGEKRKKKKRIF